MISSCFLDQMFVKVVAVFVLISLTLVLDCYILL